MSLRQQLLHSFQASKEYRHSFIEESIRIGLAAQIRAIREERQLDPKAFAEQLGKKVAWIYRLEDPNAAVPTVPSLLDVARTFDVDLQVRFRPFSERLEELNNLSEESFCVPGFDHELSEGAFDKKQNEAQGAIDAYIRETSRMAQAAFATVQSKVEGFSLKQGAKVVFINSSGQWQGGTERGKSMDIAYTVTGTEQSWEQIEKRSTANGH